jgi:predicted transcriptional regulator of viral defense system
MKKQLGRLEQQLFAYVQLRKLRTLRTGDLTGPLQVTTKQERELLSRLSRAGMIAQVRRGSYLVPECLPLGGRWSPDEGLALNTLFDAQNGRYQICGPNAFNRYGFDEQVATRVYVYNNREWGDRRIGSGCADLDQSSGQTTRRHRDHRNGGGFKSDLFLARSDIARRCLRLGSL